ncbi:hypothetical protein [Streptomyces sp. NPDC056291]|uniref:hypothetical protein n=2 Tax=Streptomyces TaxID=1883 RepID=UPI0035D70181
MKLLTGWVATLCATVLLAAQSTTVASAADPPANLLAADMDTGFDSGASSLTLSNPASGGTQQIVSVDGNNALELRDASQGTNLSSYFYL